MRYLAATLAVVGALLFSAGSAWADWDDIREAFNQGGYAIVMEELHVEFARLGLGEDRQHFAVGHLAHGKGFGEGVDPLPLYAVPQHG